MAIDRFTKEQFEKALPVMKNGEPLCVHDGLVDGEHQYTMTVNNFIRIRIRSSVDDSGYARETAEDSIRLWAEVMIEDGAWKGLPKIDAYTTRVNGWQKRMVDKARELYKMTMIIARPLPICENCRKAQPAWTVKAGPNEGRFCSKCIDCDKGFVWMDKELEGWQPETPAPSVKNTAQSQANGKSGNTSGESSGAADTVKPSGSSTRESKSDSPPSKESERWQTSATTNAAPSAQEGMGADSKQPSADVPLDSATNAKSTTSSSTAKSEGLSSQVENGDSDDIFEEMRAIAEKAFISTPKIASSANGQQMKAITAPLDRAIRVLAGPGSGKTFVIERRYAYLLANGVSPHNIAAVTFSAAMAQDLQSRILKHNKEVSGTGAENQICTIHALCNRILQAEGKGRQIPKNWQLKKLVQEIIKELWPFAAGDIQHARPNWDEVLRAFANAKGNNLLAGADADMYEGWWGEYHARRLVEARKRFDTSMRTQGLWTFNDMLFDCEQLLMTDQMVREKYQTKYQYIIVDEGQDTNHQAMRILTMLAQPQNRLFIVGDPDQLLFRFTGATPEDNLYDGFTARYPDGLTFMLETNYRSTAEIVDKANNLIEKNYQGMGGPYNEVFHKVLNVREDAETGNKISYQQYKDPAEEGEAVAEQVILMIEQGYQSGEIFIGARTKAQLGYLEGPLTKAGVKFINITGGSFWQQSHIATTLAYLRLANDPSNEEAFQRVYNVASADMRDRDDEYCPTRYLGRAFLEEVGNKYDEAEMQRACARRWAYTNGVNDLMGLMHQLFMAIPKVGVSGTVQQIIDRCMFKYLQHEEGLDGSDSENSKIADLETVVDIARKFETVDEFLNKVDEMIQAAQDAKEKKWDDYVVLSTIHRLKGMERPVVFGLGWSEGEMITADGHVIKVGLLPHTFSLTPPPSTGVLDLGGMSRMEDERCMGFVLVTRAKQEVYLSGIKFWRKAQMHPSRFIFEMGLIDRRDDAWDDELVDAE